MSTANLNMQLLYLLLRSFCLERLSSNCRNTPPSTNSDTTTISAEDTDAP